MHFQLKKSENGRNNTFTDKDKTTRLSLMFLNVKVVLESAFFESVIRASKVQCMYSALKIPQKKLVKKVNTGQNDDFRYQNEPR